MHVLLHPWFFQTILSWENWTLIIVLSTIMLWQFYKFLQWAVFFSFVEIFCDQFPSPYTWCFTHFFPLVLGDLFRLLPCFPVMTRHTSTSGLMEFLHQSSQNLRDIFISSNLLSSSARIMPPPGSTPPTPVPESASDASVSPPPGKEPNAPIPEEDSKNTSSEGVP